MGKCRWCKIDSAEMRKNQDPLLVKRAQYMLSINLAHRSNPTMHTWIKTDTLMGFRIIIFSNFGGGGIKKNQQRTIKHASYPACKVKMKSHCMIYNDKILSSLILFFLFFFCCIIFFFSPTFWVLIFCTLQPFFFFFHHHKQTCRLWSHQIGGNRKH